MNLAHYFLNAPELKLPLGTFSFPPFKTLGIDKKVSSLDFPAEKMLGKQAETLFESWLKHAKDFQLLAANIQIQGANQTLGELDYIVLDTKNNSTLHIELACKFYLLDKNQGTTALEQWIGPNLKDRLVDKLSKLKTKQFPLLHRKETTSVLNKLELDSAAIQQQYCLKAFLFVPKGFQQDTLPSHFRDCIVGFFVSYSEFTSEEEDTALFALPQKKEWLLPPKSITNWLPYSEVKEQIKNSIAKKRSPLVYKKLNTHIEQFFVVWW